MATLKDIARETQLSIKTVSLIINGGGRMAPATRARVLEVARAVGYQPNQAARTLVSRKSHLFGAVFPYTEVSFFAHILSGLEQAVAQHDYSLLLVDASTGPERGGHGWNALQRHKVDGLAMVPIPESLACFRERMAPAAIPVVQVMNVDAELGSAAVIVDNDGGVRAALEHLFELGHRRVGLITHETSFGATGMRRAVFNDFMRERGLPHGPDISEDAVITFASGAEAAARLFARRPDLTALFCCSDHAALGAMHTLLRQGRRIPGDVSVVGFDDMPEAELQASHPLTTVAQPKQEVGRLAGEMLLSMLAGEPGRQMKLPARLVVRATTASPRKRT